MKTTIIVPTWKRPQKLKLALNSLIKQIHKADEIIVVSRPEELDPVSNVIIKQFLLIDQSIKHLIVNRPGVIHAENEAIKIATGDIIFFLDDDAEAPEDWILRILSHFKTDDKLAAVGGSDFVTINHRPDYRKNVKEVGILKWYGRVVGNHHHRANKPLYVDVLKGVNMAYRKNYLSLLDEKLQSEYNKGNGSYWELDIALAATKKGGRLLFDPSIDVLHHSDHSHFIPSDNIKNSARNLTYVLLKHLPLWKKFIFILYAILIGGTQITGFAKLLQSLVLLKSPKETFRTLWFSQIGFWEGIRISLF